jgi:hypothetical protein
VLSLHLAEASKKILPQIRGLKMNFKICESVAIFTYWQLNLADF